MAKRLPVQYVRYYTDGSAARKLEIYAPTSEPQPQPKTHKQKRRKIYIDPVAVLGTVVAVVMLIMMAVGVIRLRSALEEAQLMQQYVTQLHQENARLADEYAAGYDLAEIEQTALALGMVPQDQVRHTTIYVAAPETVQEISFWEKAGTFLDGLFA